MLHHQRVQIIVNGKEVKDSDGDVPTLHLVSITRTDKGLMVISLSTQHAIPAHTDMHAVPA
jgi:hypothetical protein